MIDSLSTEVSDFNAYNVYVTVGDPSHKKKDDETASAFKITLAEKMQKLKLPSERKIKL